MLRLGAALLILCLLTGEARAQIVRGRVRDAESGAALQGVFVTLIDSAGHMRGGVLTNASGFFAMRAATAGTFRLRAERIGHEASTSAPVVLTEAEAQTVDFTVKMTAIALAPVEVATNNRCVARPRTGERTAQLWEEARKALTVARWVEDQQQVQFAARTYIRQLDAKTMQVKNEGVRHNISRNLPYAAIPADSLARHGFVRNEGAGFVFYGPDADVLLSRSFLDRHCFHSIDGSGENRGLIGLGFRPTADSKLPDIEGVLWLDRGTLELRHIDYRYTNVARIYGRYKETGGRTEFLRLKSGAWIVSKWYIRMPTVVESAVERGEPRVIALQEEGGEVLSVRDDGSAETLTHDGVVKGLVYDSVAGQPLAQAMVYLSGTSHHATTGADGRFEMRDVPAGRYTIGFTHAVLDSMPTLPTPRFVNVRQLEAASVDLAVGSVSAQIAAKCKGDSVAGVLFGLVRDDRAGPMANAEVTVSWRRYQRNGAAIAEERTRAAARTDASGFYVVCDVPLERTLEVRAARSGKLSDRTALEVADRRYRRLDLTLKD